MASLVLQNGSYTQTISFTGSANQTIDSTTFGQIIGVGQTLQNVTSSRSYGTTYTNTTGKPIFVSCTGGGNNSSTCLYLNVNGTRTSFASANNGDWSLAVNSLVPNGATYQISSTGSVSLGTWLELR